MNKYLLIAAGLMLSVFGTEVASANDYQIAVQRKKIAANRGKQAKAGGEQVKATETVNYQVTVQNRAFNKESGELQAKYVLFVERQELGSKVGTEETERVRGENKIEAMKAQGKAAFETSEVSLREQTLAGAYYYSDGGRVRAKDSLTGIWIKLFDETGAEVGEYINPTTLRNKMSWE